MFYNYIGCAVCHGTRVVTITGALTGAVHRVACWHCTVWKSWSVVTRTDEVLWMHPSEMVLPSHVADKMREALRFPDHAVYPVRTAWFHDEPRRPLWMVVWFVFMVLLVAVCILAPLDTHSCRRKGDPPMVPGMPLCGVEDAQAHRPAH